MSGSPERGSNSQPRPHESVNLSITPWNTQNFADIDMKNAIIKYIYINISII